MAVDHFQPVKLGNDMLTTVCRRRQLGRHGRRGVGRPWLQQQLQGARNPASRDRVSGVELRGFEPLTFSSRRGLAKGSKFLVKLLAKLAESSSPAEDSRLLTFATLPRGSVILDPSRTEFLLTFW